MSKPELKIYLSGLKEWHINGELHREDGPAVIYPDGTMHYWLNGEPLDFSKYKTWFINKISNPSYKLTDGDISFIEKYLE